MSIKTIMPAALLTLAMMASAPAFAGSTQDDVQSCREALIERGDVDMDAYRLRFERVKGNSQGRTLYVKAISQKGDVSFKASCSFDKTQVVAVKTGERTAYAKR